MQVDQGSGVGVAQQVFHVSVAVDTADAVRAQVRHGAATESLS